MGRAIVYVASMANWFNIFKVILFCSVPTALGFSLAMNVELKNKVSSKKNMYQRFVDKDINGKKLSEYLKPGTLGMFHDKGRYFICSEVNVKISKKVHSPSRKTPKAK